MPPTPDKEVNLGKLGMQMAGVGLTLMGGQGTARYARQVGQAQANLYIKTANYIRSLEEKDIQAYDVMADRQIGKVRAGFAGAGVRVDTGTPVDIVVASRRQHAFNRLYLRHNRRIEAQAHEDAALTALMHGDFQAYNAQATAMDNAYKRVAESTEFGNVFDIVISRTGLPTPSDAFGIVKNLGSGIIDKAFGNLVNKTTSTPRRISEMPDFGRSLDFHGK